MELVMYVVFLVIGLLVGVYFGKKSARSVKDLSGELSQALQNVANAEGKLQSAASVIGKLEISLSEKQAEVLKFSSENSGLLEKNKSTEEKVKDLNEVKEKLKNEFENLANRIFQEKMTNFKTESAANMDNVLSPFKVKLGEFQDVVNKYRDEEVRDSTSLKTEIQNIASLNQKLSNEAHNLTKALKGDKKAQGNWGELILERVLESSGLRVGEEYILQGKEMGLTNTDGLTLKPDVIINLPEGKHIIVDSKVTLNGYDRFINGEDDAERVLALKEFLGAIKNHITGLSDKKYQNLDKIISPDFVLLFIPIEGAFATALQNDTNLFNFGWDKKIIIVSPTTLMVTLKTIESIWKQEKQNMYSLEIAKQAGDLYDKFAGFIDDLDNLKRSIDKSKENFDSAMNKLTTGRGNIIGRFEKMKELGAKASKQLEIAHEE